MAKRMLVRCGYLGYILFLMVLELKTLTCQAVTTYSIKALLTATVSQKQAAMAEYSCKIQDICKKCHDSLSLECAAACVRSNDCDGYGINIETNQCYLCGENIKVTDRFPHFELDGWYTKNSGESNNVKNIEQK